MRKWPVELAVMGQNLILNMNDHGYKVAVFNRTVSKVDDFLNDEAKGRPGRRRALHRRDGGLLKRPRKRHADGQGRQAVDDDRAHLLPLPETGRHHHRRRQLALPDTIRRTKYLESKGMLFIGTGVSGGEEGARGPSIMPGGNPAAWPHVKDIFQAICAKVETATPCCDWVGEDGAGHFVKMVHNGIEYGDMQLICEAYQLLKEGLG
jgi:6-phosphogluconate dehydrogenase